jgi:hypothetical protein
VTSDSFSHEIKSNRIAFNNGNGIHIPEGPDRQPGFRIRILTNSIFSNGALGIELGDDGVTINDDKDFDTGANERQNSPVLTSALSSTVVTSITDLLVPTTTISITVAFNSTPNSTFTLQFFFASACPSQGPQSITFLPILLGSEEVTTDSNGNVSFPFSFELPSGISSGWVNSTATSVDGNTSEFSMCLMVASPIPIPRIISAARFGKRLIITGENFDNKAKLMINGQDQKTVVESPSRLIGKKAGKKVKPEDKLQVRNSDGTLSPEFIYRP